MCATDSMDMQFQMLRTGMESEALFIWPHSVQFSGLLIMFWGCSKFIAPYHGAPYVIMFHKWVVHLSPVQCPVLHIYCHYILELTSLQEYYKTHTYNYTLDNICVSFECNESAICQYGCQMIVSVRQQITWPLRWMLSLRLKELCPLGLDWGPFGCRQLLSPGHIRFV